MSSTDLAMFDGSTQLEGEAFRVVLSVEKTKSINTSVKSGETEYAIVFSRRRQGVLFCTQAPVI